MSSYFLFLILGLGSGATYAILGQGLVLKYRSAGVVDFAHGAVAMFIAYVFINLRSFGQLELPVVLIPHQLSLNGGAGLSTSVVIVISVALALTYRFSRFGLATRAGAENDRGAALTGISANRVAGQNWVIATVLAGAAGIMIAPVASLDPTSYTLFVVPALAAA